MYETQTLLYSAQYQNYLYDQEKLSEFK